jgi:hypothetical protein
MFEGNVSGFSEHSKGVVPLHIVLESFKILLSSMDAYGISSLNSFSIFQQ